MKQFKQKHILIALFGTFLEYFDYALYGFSAVIIAHTFFPPANESQLLLQTFGVFAIGHFAKPLGAFVFGHIGDKYGRKYALKYNMLGIAIPTITIGLMPGYSQWGLFSMLILICCRFMQGFFVSGEYDGVVLYIIEHIKEKHQCLGNALICIMSMTGFVIASFTVMQLKQYGDLFDTTLWRIPFIVGGCLGGIMLILRRQLAETPFFETLNSEDKKLNLNIIKSQLPNLLMFILMFGGFGGLYHFTFVFFEKFMAMQNYFMDEVLSKYHFYGLMCFVCFNPISGLMGDRYGARFTALLGLILLSCCWLSFTFYHSFLIQYYGVWLAFVAASMSLLGVQIHIIAIEFVNPHYRYRIINLGHTFGSAFLSGLAPTYAMLIYQKTENANLVYAYPLTMIGGIFIAILAMIYYRIKFLKPILP